MKRLYVALISLMLVFGVSANSLAADFTIDGNNITPGIQPLSLTGSYSVGNDTSYPVIDGGLDMAAGSVLDYWNFTVSAPANYNSALITIGNVSAEGFTSFATSLQTYVTDDGGGWTTITTGLTNGGGTFWASAITNFGPLSPDPTMYRLVVSGTKLAGTAFYGGGISVSPVPEPEIYAMMAAGLGLMGFVARRRQRNGAVA